MRTLSTPARDAIFEESTDEVLLCFLDIELPSGTFYAVNNWEAVTRGGNTYLGHPFDLALPDEVEEQVPTVTLKISNVDSVLIKEIQALTGPIDVTINVALHSSPDTTEAGPFDMQLSGVTWDDTSINATLTYDEVMLEAFPGFVVDPATHLAAF